MLWAALGGAEQIPACQGGKENLSEQLLTSKILHVGEGSCSSPEQCVQAGREGRWCCWRQRNSRCVLEQPCCSAVSQGNFRTACSEQPRMLPLVEKVLWPCVQHQSIALYHFFLSKSLKIYSLLFREMQRENLQNNHFLFRWL